MTLFPRGDFYIDLPGLIGYCRPTPKDTYTYNGAQRRERPEILSKIMNRLEVSLD